MAVRNQQTCRSLERNSMLKTIMFFGTVKENSTLSLTVLQTEACLKLREGPQIISVT